MKRRLVFSKFNYHRLRHSNDYSKAIHNYFYTDKHSMPGPQKDDTLKFLSIKSHKADTLINTHIYMNNQPAIKILKEAIQAWELTPNKRASDMETINSLKHSLKVLLASNANNEQPFSKYP